MKIVIDTETTGTNNRLDEILQLSIIDYDTGAVLMDQYFKPAHKRRWFEAQRVNGISPALVADKRGIADALPEIQAIFDQTSQVIGYNSSFDVGFLQVAGVTINAPILDVMPMFSPIYGEWNDYYGNYKWQSLTVANDECIAESSKQNKRSSRLIVSKIHLAHESVIIPARPKWHFKIYISN